MTDEEGVGRATPAPAKRQVARPRRDVNVEDMVAVCAFVCNACIACICSGLSSRDIVYGVVWGYRVSGCCWASSVFVCFTPDAVVGRWGFVNPRSNALLTSSAQAFALVSDTSWRSWSIDSERRPGAVLAWSRGPLV